MNRIPRLLPVVVVLATGLLPLDAPARAPRRAGASRHPAAEARPRHPAPPRAAIPPVACSRLEGGLVTPTTDLATWSRLEANSEQRQPVYLGSTPRQIALGLASSDAPGPASLPEAFRVSARSIFPALARAVARTAHPARGTVSFEAWPVLDDDGRATWAVARWRMDRDPWTWLDSEIPTGRERERGAPAPMLPVLLRPWVPAERAVLFDDVALQPGLYDKPAFGDCAWTGDSGTVVESWLPLDLREARAASMTAAGAPRLACRRIPQPARLNGRSWTFEIRVARDGAVEFPACLGFAALPSSPPPRAGSPAVTAWPPDFDAAFRTDVRAVAGEDETAMPDGRRVRFTRRNAMDPQNHLETLVDWLEARYKALGIATRRQRFPWHGVPQSNLVAVIPGSAPDASAHPVLLADHVDTAFCQDVYDRTWQRVSAPGADDNGAATAALLQAARVLKDSHPLRDIWLVHLAGEEFPADDLGARRFLSDVLARKQDLGPLVLLDMIGWRTKGDPVVQVSPGRSPGSADAASVAADAARIAKGLRAEVRPVFDPRSYLYNTDGWVFDAVGFPVVLINEHLNRTRAMGRDGYHDSTDRSDRIDWAYASAVARMAIETVARLAAAPAH